MLRSVLSRLPELRHLTASTTSAASNPWQPLGCVASHALQGLQQQQCRTIIRVKVYNNQVDKAARALTRILITDRVLDTWKRRAFNMKPATKRVEQQKETALRLKKRNFRQSLRLAMQRKDRCVNPRC